jgi:tetratricopeptide (TPR) repeat protein
MAISQGESFRDARRLYDEQRSPKTTQEMRRLLTQTKEETCLLHAITVVCDYLNHWNNTTLKEVAEQARLINRILKANPGYYLAHYAKGFVHRARNQHRAAHREFGEAFRLSAQPFARARAQQGEELIYLGRFAAGIAEVEAALRMRPESVAGGMFHWMIGRAQFFEGNYAEAVPHLEQSIAQWPSLWYNRCYLIAAQYRAGNPAAATQALAALNSVGDFAGLKVHDVVDNEIHVPATNRRVKEARGRFHQALRDAGMPP